MNLGAILWIVAEYETVAIQTMQITINDLNKDKIKPIGDMLRLTVNSKEDVFINVKDIKAIYGKNRKDNLW